MTEPGGTRTSTTAPPADTPSSTRPPPSTWRWGNVSADEAANPLRTVAERRGGETSGEFGVVRPSADTVVLLAGQPALLDNAAVSADRPTVTVWVPVTGGG